MLLDVLDSLTPSWAKKPARKHWWSLFGLCAAFLDGLLDGVWEGRIAGMPLAVDVPGVPGYGGADDVAALAMIGRDRLIVQGLAESHPDYAYRLRHWREAWALGGTVYGLLQAVAAVLQPDVPLLRYVSTNGTVTTWWTREVDGTIRVQRSDGKGFYLAPDGTSGLDSTTAHAWDWDSTTSPPPPDQGDRSRGWLLIYTPAASPYLTSTEGLCGDPGLVGDLWNDPLTVAPLASPWAGTVGTNAPLQLVELVRGVLDQRAAAGNQVAWIVVAFDGSSFDPDGSSSSYPDGTWGHHSRYDSGANTRVPARLTTARYWPAAPGGRAPG